MSSIPNPFRAWKLHDWILVLALGGLSLFSITFGSPIVITGDHNKVERKDEPAKSPIANLCPDGWIDTSSKDDHGLVLSCSREWTVNGQNQRWLVILNQDGSFNYGLQTEPPAKEFVWDKAKVPWW